jgi:tetratricopeptide (TPR) repeat protein
MTATQAKLSWYDVDSEVKQLLILASDNWDNTELSEQYMKEALAKADNNLDVLIGAYRFFFYKSKSEAALKIATQVMQIIKQQENLPTEWEQLQPILNSRKNEPAIRLYLNAYAATGFVFARLGRLEEAKIVTERVKQIDEKRESCATTVFEVLTQPPEEDE